MPLIVTPQLLTCGLFAPRDQMAGWLQHISDYFPLTYSVEALQDVGVNPSPTSTYWTDLGIVGAVVIVALVAAAATLRRRTA
jgi:ABC-2 type transport system permease protein